MSLQSAYFRLPVFLQNAALSAFGISLRRKRYGGIHAAETAAATERLRWGRQQLEEYTERKLFEVLVHAKRHVPFYRDHSVVAPGHPSEARQVLTTWPVLDKATVQDAGALMISERTTKRHLVYTNTGGTTGRALSIASTPSVLQRNYAFFERFKQQCGVVDGERVATFAGRPIVAPTASEGPYWRRNFAANQLLLSSYHLRPSAMDEYVAALAAFSPALIDAYPSSLEPIAMHIVERGGERPVKPRAVITSSETLSGATRTAIEEAFGCKVFDHYGSAEMVALVTQCRHGGYHVNSDFGLLELIDDSGKSAFSGSAGEIVSTGFINDVMPLIRYRMGDLASWSEEPCGCGSPFPVLRELLGRIDDVIVTPDGRRIGRLDPIFKAVKALHEARIVQTALNHIRVELVCGEGFSDQDGTELQAQLGYRLGAEMQISIVRVDAIPRTKSGKLRLVESPYARRERQ